VQIRLNRTDKQVFSFVTDSESFGGRASGQWTDKQYYNSTSASERNGHTCRYDTGDPPGRRAGIMALPLQGDRAADGDQSYDANEKFALIVSRGPSASANCDGLTTPVRDAPYAYDGASSCHFATDREYLRTAPPIRIPISRLGEDEIMLEQRFQHTVGGCFPGGGFGNPEEYCVFGGCWKGSKSRSGTYRVTMTLIKP